jgi:drug/metabolite transporter (DMT)-like permease
MSWLYFALAGPVLWAISTHLDKYLVERYFKTSNVAVMLVFTSLAGLVLMPFIWWFAPTVTAGDSISIGLIMVSGLLYMGALFFYLKALQEQEASVVAPFFQASPLFSYGLGYVVLGETLSTMQLAGGAMIVAGTLMVSIRIGQPRERIRWRLAALMLACGFALALGTLIFKVFAVSGEFWPTTFWLFAGEVIFGAALLAVPSYRRQFVHVLRANTVPLLTINASNELINLAGTLSNRYALLLAPLSIVQAIGSTTTLFVFVFGVAFSYCGLSLAREDLSPRELARKGLAAILVAIGVALVSV